jgi:hypothetical protein
MACGSQYFIQIMATQTRFDLNAAIENWRNELAAQAQLTPDNRRELEKHLADSVTDLHGRGLSEEESFWLAQRRIGQPRQLAEEFVKANPAKVWRERAFWMVLGLLAFSLWQRLVDMCLPLFHWDVRFQGQMRICRFVLVYVLPIIVFLLTQRRAVKNGAAFYAFFKTRWRFTVVMLFFVTVTHGWQAFDYYRFRAQMAGQVGRRLSGHAFDGFWLNQFAFLGFPLMLLAVAIWLLPMQKLSRRMEKPA